MGALNIYRRIPVSPAAVIAALVAGCLAVALTAWRTPTIALVMVATWTRFWVPFSATLSSVLLGTGAVAWAISCLMLRSQGGRRPLHVL